MDRRFAIALATVLAAGSLAAGDARAQAAAPKPLGLTLDLGYRTAYLLRGLNVFGNRPMDAFGLFEPSVTWAVPDTGLTIGWWAGFQTNGNNVGRKLASALGCEQDLWVNQDIALPADLTLALGLTGYAYPMASAAVTGASYPWYVEPRVGLAWAGPVVLSVNVLYYLGIQDTASIRGASYLYVNPKVAKTFAPLSFLKIDLALSYGYKYYKGGNDGRENVHDVLLKGWLTFRPWGKLYLAAGAGAAWTDLNGRSAADEFSVFGTFNTGVEL